MAHDDQHDLFDEEEYDFVDDEDSDLEDESAGEATEQTDVDDQSEIADKPKQRGGKRAASKGNSANTGDKSAEQEATPEPEVPAGPPADHVIHVYQHNEYSRTIDREFTAEEADAFAAEYNRTAKAYGRKAFSAEKDDEPIPTIG